MDKVLPGFEQMVGSGSVNSYDSDPAHPFESVDRGRDRRQSRSSDDLSKCLLDGDVDYEEFDLGVAPSTEAHQGAQAASKPAGGGGIGGGSTITDEV